MLAYVMYGTILLIKLFKFYKRHTKQVGFTFDMIGAIINDGLVTGWSVYYIWCTYITVW